VKNFWKRGEPFIWLTGGTLAFCMIMIEDGVKTAAEDRPVQVLDIAEVLEQATQHQ